MLHGIDLSFRAFFRRLRNGKKAGYPRFRPGSRWHHIAFPHGDRALRLTEGQKKVRIPGVGAVRLRQGREIPPYKRAWLHRRNDRWYVCFECERKITPLPATGRIIGVDVGFMFWLSWTTGG